jgi:hypothetical protein
MTKPKPKSNWMRGFVLPPKTPEADKVRIETALDYRDYINKQRKRGRT